MQNTKIADTIFRYFQNNYNGVFIEVGAAHPVNISVSFCFRPLAEQKRMWHFDQAHELIGKEPVGKWKIISVEPNPEFCDEFKKMGIPVLQYAACGEDKGQTTFKISPCPMSCSSLEVRYPGPCPIENGAGGWWAANEFKTINVEALTLNTILNKHHPEINKIDVLVVDTEGWELEVVKGFDIKRFNPKIIILENVQSDPAYNEYMESLGYKLEIAEDQDQFFIRQ